MIELNKIIIFYNPITTSSIMSVSLQKSIDLTLQNMLEKVKPKARYISEVHVDEYNDSIYKQIINGDIEIPKERQSIEKKQEKHGYEEMLRKKFLQQIEKEKANLQHKLGYISNSINSMKKYDELRASVRSPISMRESYTMGALRSQSQEWRQQIKVREKQLEQKKKKVEEEKKKREEEMKEISARLKEEQNEKKKKQIMEKMKVIEERMKNREEQIKTGNERYIKLRNEKSLHEKLNESYQQKEKSFLEEQKKKLAQIRNLRKPIDQNELKQHDIKFMQLKRQKQELRERQRKMNESRSKTYKPMYESMFYKQIVEGQKNEEQNPSVVKSEKMKQFAEHVKEHFVPAISDKKRQQIEQLLERQKRKQEERLQKQKQLLEKSKVKGLQYLQIIRSIPKKKKQERIIAEPQTDRIKYHNYLTHHSSPDNSSKQPWSKILNSSNDKQVKALKIQFESQKKQQELKRKQQTARLLKQGDSSKIDDQYFSMIKAKLDLLKD